MYTLNLFYLLFNISILIKFSYCILYNTSMYDINIFYVQLNLYEINCVDWVTECSKIVLHNIWNENTKIENILKTWFVSNYEIETSALKFRIIKSIS